MHYIAINHIADLCDTDGIFNVTITVEAVDTLFSNPTPIGSTLTDFFSEVFLSGTDQNPANNTDTAQTIIPGIDLYTTITADPFGSFP